MKSFKIQSLIIDFETIKMEEDETFDTFYSKLKVVTNSLYNLGKIISESRVVNKILQSLGHIFLRKSMLLKIRT